MTIIYLVMFAFMTFALGIAIGTLLATQLIRNELDEKIEVSTKTKRGLFQKKKIAKIFNPDAVEFNKKIKQHDTRQEDVLLDDL